MTNKRKDDTILLERNRQGKVKEVTMKNVTMRYFEIKDKRNNRQLNTIATNYTSACEQLGLKVRDAHLVYQCKVEED